MKAVDQAMTANDLRAWRERLQLTQAEAAELLGCPLRSLQNWEIGHRPIPALLPSACEGAEVRYRPIRNGR